LTRREWLKQVASWSAFMTLGRSGEAQVTVSPAANVRGTARACIFINLAGAPSHLDTFDPKDGPWNPADADLRQYSGGIVLSNTLFPLLSRITNDLLILRSVSSWEAEHTRGQFYLQTAHPANPAFIAETPHIGAVVALEKNTDSPLPPFLTLNSFSNQGATFLGGAFQPMAAPANAGGLATLEHNFFGSQSRQRFEERYRLLEELEAPLRAAPFDRRMADHADFYASAKQLMYDPAISNVFRFSGDDAGRYGNTNFARSCLVARNAIQAESGTVFVNVTQQGWDTHQNMFDRRYTPNIYQLTNELDRAVGALVEDLKASGNFAETMIVIMGEFGRTPGALNARGGRDHHKHAMSVAMLGGGVRGGRAIGATDREGDRVTDPGWRGQRPIVMEDLAATIYSALGINWTKSITDTPSGRKFEYVPYADLGAYFPVEEVFG